MHFGFAGICARPAEIEAEHAYIKCPTCGSDTVALGQTEFDTASDNDDEPTRSHIVFLTNCIVMTADLRLTMDDFSLAGLDDAYDRSDDLGKWAAQQDY
jgi:hypothetical protein